MTPDVSVSIVTYNNETCIGDLMGHLEAQEQVSWEALVFDNASTDGTRERLSRTESVRLFANDTNAGYSKGHNVNIGRSRGRYVLLLDPDVTFPSGMLSRLVAHLDRHPEQAMAGPRILEGASRRHFAPRRFYPGEGMIELEPGISRSQVAWLNGCCILARRDVLLELSGFDEDFLLYQAETDLCLRARRLGFAHGWVPDVVVHHLHRQSQRDSSEYEYSRRLFEGSAVFWRKHYLPRDVLAMAGFQLRLTRLLLAALGPFERLGVVPPELRRERLRARRDVCLEVVASLDATGSNAAAGARIALRQPRLALEWIRHGRFPLDDY